jgi:L-ascorbate metabolism protein UlaG (beta-lactamase superfamily)
MQSNDRPSRLRREPWRDRASDHFDVARQQFFNPWKNTDRTFRDVLRWWWDGRRRPWPRVVANLPYPPPPNSVDDRTVAVTLIGHATVLIRVSGKTVLTDPQFSTHAGAFGRLGAPRVRAPGLPLHMLPPIDVVFVSHSHYDHLDLTTIAWIASHRGALFVCGLGVGRLLERAGAQRVVECDWWDVVPVHGMSLTFTPAQHWSNRSPFDRRATLWGGCYVSPADGPRVYFAGDSGYAPCFSEIRARLGPPDVALLPIGAYEPRWIMEGNHMNPEEAVQAHLDVGARISVAIHHGCFRLSDEGFDEPVRDLLSARESRGLPADAFRVIDVGESVVVEGRG